MKYAQVLADVAFLHTDHPYDYAIPERFQAEIKVGMRVKVHFGGRKVLGFVSSLSDTTSHKSAGEILEVLDTFAVVKPDVANFCSALASRYLTAQSQVLSFAIPTSAKRVNQKLLTELPVALTLRSGATSSDQHSGGSTSYLLSPTINLQVWSANKILELIERDMRGIVLVANYSLLHQIEEKLLQQFPEIRIGVMAADMTPSQRYEQFMRIWRSEVHVVLGTRSAVFAPLEKLDYIVMIHENDDSFVEQQSGHWHVRDAALLRCLMSRAVFVAIGYTRSIELQQQIQMGNVRHVAVEGNRPVKTLSVPKDDASDRHRLRLPSIAFNVIRQGLQVGPVLLVVPLRGYQLNIQCARCREKAACEECGGGLEQTRTEIIHCTRCGKNSGQFRCQWCSHTQVRSISIGSVRTAEEIGKAFPNIPVYTSGRNHILEGVDDAPCIVISTPGAEPEVRDGLYAAIVILDPEITLNRIDLRAHEEAFRRWYNLKALAHATGVQLICMQDVHPVIRHIMNDDPQGFAVSQLQERIAAQLPPATDCYLLEGDFENISGALLDVASLPDVTVLGPAKHKLGFYALVQTQENKDALNATLRAVLARRSSTKAKGVLKIRYSPQVLP